VPSRAHRRQGVHLRLQLDNLSQSGTRFVEFTAKTERCRK
jgi:hypothetical protein